MMIALSVIIIKDRRTILCQQINLRSEIQLCKWCGRVHEEKRVGETMHVENYRRTNQTSYKRKAFNRTCHPM